MNKGFTLLETLFVIAIIAIVSAIIIPTMSDYIQETKSTADTYALRMLNDATDMFKITHELDYEIFNNSNTSDSSRMVYLIESI